MYLYIFACVQVLCQTVANVDGTGLHATNFSAWQKLCDELATCHQLEVQQQLLLGAITRALAVDNSPAVHEVNCCLGLHINLISL